MSGFLDRHQAAVRYPLYERVDALWVITTYYNPCRYKTRRDNYDLFAKAMRDSGINMITVECAFGDEGYELPESLDVLHVRSKSLLWQKERLLNLAASWLPQSAKYVVWADCDILFQNPQWAVHTAELLKTHMVAQLFGSCLRLAKGNTLGATPDRAFSFGAVTPGHLDLLSCGRYDRHGHTGYAWAMRRELFDEVGLYEHSVAGSADHYIAHAIYNVYGFCVEHSLKGNPPQIDHLKDWGKNDFTSGCEAALQLSPVKSCIYGTEILVTAAICNACSKSRRSATTPTRTSWQNMDSHSSGALRWTNPSWSPTLLSTSRAGRRTVSPLPC
jgi:hypothetical protein